MIYRLSFHINYHTNANQTVAVEIIGNKGRATSTVNLSSPDACAWSGDIEMPLTAGVLYSYNYIILEYGKEVIREVIYPKRSFLPNEKNGLLCFYDTWRYDTRQTNYNSSALSKIMFPYIAKIKSDIIKIKSDIVEKISDIRKSPNNIVFKICVLTPRNSDFKVVITGENNVLGNWNPAQGIEMKRVSNYEYAASIPYSAHNAFSYKYVILLNNNTLWENGENRFTEIINSAFSTTVNDGWIRIPSFTDWRGCGMVVPLFSLHSKDSDGIGDFYDLKKLIKWGSKVGFTAIQLLPINDTTTFGTWRDSYPYNTVSSFALNPIYINLGNAGYVSSKPYKTDDDTQVDYEAVYKYKANALSELYKKEKATLQANKKFNKFKKDNAFWLDSYAVYCALRDKHHSLNFAEWEGYEKYDCKKAEQDHELQEQAEFYKYIQFVAFSQMSSAKAYAKSKHIILKGDIPIGVNLNSCDVWTNPSLFNKDMSTGAPPDYFSKDGQNWGFPTYNWDEMAKDGYSWWKNRLEIMSLFFDAYRIDHVLGFFRIWEIPRKYTSAKFGHFSPALPYSENELLNYGFNIKPEHIDTLFFKDKNENDKFLPVIDAHDVAQYINLNEQQRNAFNNIHNDFYGHRNEKLWESGAIEKLGKITSVTGMLTCAEDLGMLPSCVGNVLEQLNILSLEIQSMPKQSGNEFAKTEQYPYRSVATLTTHDMPSFRLWWKRYPETAKRYAEKILGLHSNVPQDASVDICTKVIESHLKSPSMLCLLSFQDWSSICNESRANNVDSEQINDPANSKQYWRYKMHLSIEDLEHSKLFSEKIRKMISEADRDLFQ